MCNEECLSWYQVEVQAVNGGVNCAHIHGDERYCSPGEDYCPDTGTLNFHSVSLASRLFRFVFF